MVPPGAVMRPVPATSRLDRLEMQTVVTPRTLEATLRTAMDPATEETVVTASAVTPPALAPNRVISEKIRIGERAYV